MTEEFLCPSCSLDTREAIKAVVREVETVETEAWQQEIEPDCRGLHCFFLPGFLFLGVLAGFAVCRTV